MSTCLLTSSFLSTSARAASFSQLANQIPTLSGLSEVQRKQKWNSYTLQEKQEAWKRAKLTPDFVQAMIDMQTSFTESDLSSSNNKIRHQARKKKAELSLYIAGTKQGFKEKVEGYISQGKIPTLEEAAQDLEIDYDAKKTSNKLKKNQNVRRAEKDKKALLDQYIHSITTSVKEKEYITTGQVPELGELEKALNISKEEAKHRRTTIRYQVMANEKPKLVRSGTVLTKKELHKRFGKDTTTDDTKYIDYITTEVMHTKKQEYVNTDFLPKISEIMKEFKVDKERANLYLTQIKAGIDTKADNNQTTTKPFTKHSRTTTNTAGTSSGVPFYTGREEQEKTLPSLVDIFKRVLRTARHTKKSVQNLYIAVQEEESINKFEGFMQEKNYFQALITAKEEVTDPAQIQKAANTIISNLNNDTIKSILFQNSSDASNRFNFDASLKDRPFITVILNNVSKEQQTSFITQISKYASENLISLISQNGLQGQAALDVIKLATIVDKAPVEKLLNAQLEVKNILRLNNVKDSNIQNLPATLVLLINSKLQELEITTHNLTHEQIIDLIKNWNQTVLDRNISILISDSDLLQKEIDEKFKLITQNNSVNNTNGGQGNVPPPPPGNIPPPPPGNIPPLPPVNIPSPLPMNFSNSTNSRVDLDKLKASYPDFHSSYSQWIEYNKKTPKAKINNTTTTSEPKIEYGPLTEYSQLYKDYKDANKGTNKGDNVLLVKKLDLQKNIIGVIRQVVTASYAEQGSDIETLINLFNKENPKIREEAIEVFKKFKQDSSLQTFLSNIGEKNINMLIFDEDADEAIKRILYLPGQLDTQQKIKAQEVQQKIKAQEVQQKLPLKLTTNPLEKLRTAHENGILKTQVDELITDVHILPYTARIEVLNFLNKGDSSLDENDRKLKKEISINTQQTIKHSILSALNVNDVVEDESLDGRSLVDIIKDKDHKLLKNLLEAKVVWEENKLANSEFSRLHTELKSIFPFIKNMSKDDLKKLFNKITISGIRDTFEKSSATNNAVNNTHASTGNGTSAPPPPPPFLNISASTSSIVPPPPPGAGFTNSTSASSIFKQINIRPDLIDRIDKLQAKTIKVSSNNKPKFSPIGQKCYDFLTGNIEPSDIDLKNLSDVNKVKYVIYKDVSNQYLNSLENKKSNILKELDKNEKAKQEVLTSLKPGFTGPKTEIADTLYKLEHPDLAELHKAFNTVSSDYIGHRTELGKVIYAIYAKQYLTLLNDHEFVKLTDEESILKNVDKQALKALVVELEAKQAELEEVSNTYNQSEDSNNKDLIKKITAILKLASKDHDSNKEELLPDNTTTSECNGQDESSNKTDESEDKELSALSSIQRQAIDASDNKKSLLALSSIQRQAIDASDNKKSLLALRSSDEELEESNNTTEEESKKDIALESEDEAIDVSFKTEAIAEQDEATQRQQVSAETNNKVAVLEVVDRTISVTNKHIYSNIFNNRLDIAPIVAAGDEEPTIARGVWISGLYGINKQGAWKNIPKYQGRTTGVTIGADAEFINSPDDVIGIAYSRLESQIKYNKKLGKIAVNGHLLSIYGLKELIKGFSLQAITSYDHNYIKNKSKSINNIIGKYQNNNLSFQTLLNYKYRTKYDLHFIPNIGFKYDYSRASNYKEYNVDIENLIIQKKSNQSFESSIGGKIVFKPIATVNNIVLTPSLYGNIERHFNNKNTKVNAKATFKGQTLQETIIIPKQPKLGYNIGSNILMSRKNINVLLEYNYYTHRKYQSHQGLIKLKVNL
ncbi:MAG: autotransporter outer membrane beta-barrel domain-containing protein [Rickettsia endosymbiont of Ecitomorpha arachnoides]|nr:autotransporter outer membrane beta-barrel domain-containing protein [Rickettsia endosymbiont of Ecitomorpha arachnoides]